MAHDVFISFSSTDQNAALAVLHGLEAEGVRCWMAPRDIKPGANWAKSIMEGIAGCRVMVVVFSSNANRSEHVINEVDAAVRKGAIIIPFRIEDVMPDGAMEYHLRTRHWIDALTPGMEEHTARLAAQIKGLLQSGEHGSIPTPPPRPMPEGLPAMRRSTAPPAPPRNWKRIGRLAGVGAVVIVAGALWLSREHPVGTVTFTIREVSGSGANDASLRVTSGSLRFFEGGDPMPALDQRRYATDFAAGASRYIYPEIHLTSEAPGRVVSVPMSCEIFGRNGAVSGAVIINGLIQPTWTDTYHAHGYGSTTPGTWKPGRYRADCKYGDKLIDRDWFEVSEGGAPGAAGSAPRAAPPAAPPAPTQGIGNGTFAPTIDSLKLFESAKGTVPQSQRVYRTLFDRSSTRYVNVEVTLHHQPPGRVTSYQLVCRFMHFDGTSLGTVNLTFSIQPSWTYSVNFGGWGSQVAGSWQAGVYRVSCNDGRRDVGQVAFELR